MKDRHSCVSHAECYVVFPSLAVATLVVGCTVVIAIYRVYVGKVFTVVGTIVTNLIIVLSDTETASTAYVLSTTNIKTDIITVSLD